MTISGLRLVGCIAWAGVAISAAMPVHARVITVQSEGNYASCSANSEYIGTAFSCWNGNFSFPYEMTIKFVSENCSSGTCNPHTASTMTEFVYSAGRKIVTWHQSCADPPGPYQIFALDSCSC